jgi:hypothetical protein
MRVRAQMMDFEGWNGQIGNGIWIDHWGVRRSERSRILQWGFFFGLSRFPSCADKAGRRPLEKFIIRSLEPRVDYPPHRAVVSLLNAVAPLVIRTGAYNREIAMAGDEYDSRDTPSWPERNLRAGG